LEESIQRKQLDEDASTDQGTQDFYNCSRLKVVLFSAHPRQEGFVTP